MPRAIWSGSISFGLVNVPVKLYSAVRSHDVSFHQLEEGTGARIRYKRVSEDSGEEVPYERIVKGYEVAKDRYVTVTPEELETVEPEATRRLDIEDFVDLEAVDPIYFDATYYLAPDRGGEKAYALLTQAMARSGRVAIGRFVMRTKQYLAAVRPIGDVLAVTTMRFPDEVVDRDTIEGVPDASGVSDRELAAADQLIDSLTADWDPERYHDTYRDQVLELIDRKAGGEEVVTRPAAAEPAAVIDLMAALEASLAAGGRRSEGDRPAAAAGADDDELDSLTREQLYERAQQAGIEGRSGMTKKQLVAALRDVDGAGRRQSA